MKKLVTIILALTFIFIAASCSGSGGGKESTLTSADSGSGAQTPDSGEADPYANRYKIKEEVPNADYEGYTFTVYLRSEEGNNTDFVAETESGDIVEDAVYRRNLAVSERYNINIAFNYDDTHNTTYDTTAIKSIMAGEDVNDVLALHGAFAFNHAKRGYLVDWKTQLPWVDLEKPWWDGDFAENMAIAGRLYAMTGDISHLSVAATFCLIFNKNLFDTSNIVYPYQSVLDGSWTYDRFAELCKNGTADLNGDGTVSPSDDRYGLYTSNWNYPISTFYMAGDRVISIDAEGVPSLTVYNDRTVDIIERFIALCDTGSVYVDGYSPKYDDSIFKNERALFLGASLGSLAGLRSMDADIGVIPCPKYNETIEKYYSLVDAGQNVFSVPITAGDTERTSAILESLCAEGYREVVPVFFDQALKVKYSRDNESADMLEIIRGGRIFDYGYYDATVSWDLSYIGRNVLLGGGNFTSYYNSRKVAAEKNLELLYEQYLKG